MKIRMRFSTRLLLFCTFVAAVILGYREYVLLRIRSTKDVLRLVQQEVKNRGGESFDIGSYAIDPRFRSWHDFLLVVPPRVGVCTLTLRQPNEDKILETLISSGFSSCDYVGWFSHEEDSVLDFNEESETDQDESDAKKPVPEKFTYVASSTLDSLVKLEIVSFSCWAPIAIEDMSKLNQIRGLHRLRLEGNWITDAHLNILQPSHSIMSLDIGSDNITELGLMELIDRMPRPSSLGIDLPFYDPRSQRLYEYIKKRETANGSR